MSCMLVNDENLSKIGNFLARLLNCGYNSFGFSADREIHSAFKDCIVSYYYDSNRIYEELYKLNVKAYNSRYKEENVDELYIPKNQNIDIWQGREMENGIEIAQKWHYEILKHLQCLHYQLTEDITSGDIKTKAIEKLINTIAMYIVTHNKIYGNISWN